MGKLLAVLGLCSAATVLSISGARVTQQDDSAKRKAIEQMRQVANAVKQCPGKESSQEGECMIDHWHVGPPTNLEWDVLPSNTVRSPFQGVIEFTIPRSHERVLKSNIPQKQQKYCAQMAALEASIQGDVDAKVTQLEQKFGHDGHYRLEFDVGSSTPELVKILWVAKYENDTTRTSAVSDNSHECWIEKAKSIGSAKPENEPPPPR